MPDDFSARLHVSLKKYQSLIATRGLSYTLNFIKIIRACAFKSRHGTSHIICRNLVVDATLLLLELFLSTLKSFLSTEGIDILWTLTRVCNYYNRTIWLNCNKSIRYNGCSLLLLRVGKIILFILLQGWTKCFLLNENCIKYIHIQLEVLLLKYHYL